MIEEIDWNKMSELGLIRRINTDILHPLGLAMTRNPVTGTSDTILISDDGVWEYEQPPEVDLTNDEIRDIIKSIREGE